MENGFKSLAMTYMMAKNKAEFDKKIRNYKADIQYLNKNCEIAFEIQPNPEEIIEDFETTQFIISIYYKDDDEIND